MVKWKPASKLTVDVKNIRPHEPPLIRVQGGRLLELDGWKLEAQSQGIVECVVDGTTLREVSQRKDKEFPNSLRVFMDTVVTVKQDVTLMDLLCIDYASFGDMLAAYTRPVSQMISRVMTNETIGVELEYYDVPCVVTGSVRGEPLSLSMVACSGYPMELVMTDSEIYVCEIQWRELVPHISTAYKITALGKDAPLRLTSGLGLTPTDMPRRDAHVLRMLFDCGHQAFIVAHDVDTANVQWFEVQRRSPLERSRICPLLPTASAANHYDLSMAFTERIHDLEEAMRRAELPHVTTVIETLQSFFAQEYSTALLRSAKELSDVMDNGRIVLKGLAPVVGWNRTFSIVTKTPARVDGISPWVLPEPMEDWWTAATEFSAFPKRAPLPRSVDYVRVRIQSLRRSGLITASGSNNRGKEQVAHVASDALFVRVSARTGQNYETLCVIPAHAGEWACIAGLAIFVITVDAGLCLRVERIKDKYPWARIDIRQHKTMLRLKKMARTWKREEEESGEDFDGNRLIRKFVGAYEPRKIGE